MPQQPLSQYLATEPKGTLEKIAEDYNCSLYDVICAIPSSTVVDGKNFDAVWQHVLGWGKIILIVHTPDTILEYAGNLPNGSHQHGYFNLDHTTGISGHIKAENCAHIAFIERKFMGVKTASIVFLNKKGESIIKIFLSRDEKRQLLTNQLEAFQQLANSLGN